MDRAIALWTACGGEADPSVTERTVVLVIEVPWPYVGSEALSSGVISERTMRRLHRPVYPNIYVPRDAVPSARQRAQAAWLWSKRHGIVASLSASAVLGAKWIDPSEPAELIHDNRRPPPDLIVRTEAVLAGEIIEHNGMQVTTPARTAFDLGRHIRSPIAAVQRLDALANATDVKRVDVEAVMAAHPAARGNPRLLRVLPLMDAGAESPQETIARLVLVDAGLPSPVTQFRVFDEYGQFVARLDMAYDDVMVGVEYDGAQQWTDPAVRQRDIDKQFALTELGWLIVRVSRDLLRYRRAAYVARVENALRSRGFGL
jgi:very-short-patch-repair endonuclease